MTKGQLEFQIPREKESDRNFHLGGRSFYFFDFDDNIAFLSTPLILFHRKTGEERLISSGEFAREQRRIGDAGPFKDFEVRYDSDSGTFRNFRDHSEDQLRRWGSDHQVFVKDLGEALGLPDLQWKGPSWSCFYHATFNQRPLSVITARGHSPETLKEGIRLFVRAGHLTQEPNFLSLFPVNHLPTRALLGDHDLKLNTAQLKQRAIRRSVEKALEVYGPSPHHRFGMSDDDPHNIELITDEMQRLKQDYPEMGFFIIEAHDQGYTKREVTRSGLGPQVDAVQHPLFEQDEPPYRR